MPFAYERKGSGQDFFARGIAAPVTSADTLGKRIARARILAGAERGKPFTQTELARTVGVTPPTVSQWESGASEPALAMIRRIGAALGVTPAYLAFGNDEPIAHILVPDAIADTFSQARRGGAEPAPAAEPTSPKKKAAGGRPAAKHPKDRR